MPPNPGRPAAVVVALGASAGGIEPVCTIVSGLPRDIRAAVLVVVHLNAAAPSVLDHILARCGPLPVSFASDGDLMEEGHVYIAPADYHLLIAGDRLTLDHGPTVNASRPSVDVLFTSLAATYGPRSVGVILSGTRDDGAAGLHAIHQAGGHTIVQDPKDAVFPGMPTAACDTTAPDAVAPAQRIAGLISQIVEGATGSGRGAHTDDDPPEQPSEAPVDEHPPGRPSELACPECGGVLWEQPGDLPGFRCRVGHAYSPDSLVSRHSQKLEAVLWSAVVALEERADLFSRLSRRVASRGGGAAKRRYERDAERATRDAAVLRSVVTALANPPSPAD